MLYPTELQGLNKDDSTIKWGFDKMVFEYAIGKNQSFSARLSFVFASFLP